MLQRSFDLFKACWQVLKADKELIWFPIISSLAMLVVTILFLLPASVLLGLFGAASGADTSNSSFLGYVLAFLWFFVAYFVWFFVAYFVSLYFNVALIGAALIRLDGGDPTLGDGIRIANSRLGKIAQYAAVSAFVSLVLQQVRERAGFLGEIVGFLGEAAWNVISFLVLPVLIVQDISVFDAIKRSMEMLKKTWGEQLVVSGGMGIVFGLITVILFVVGGGLIFLLAQISVALTIVGVIVLLTAIAVLGAISGALGGIYKAMLYRYAETGEVGMGMDGSLLAGAFKEKRKR
ncbi:MAG: DUF6159 family protein [Anaerolineae bacterium]|nr:DUF6159 family protein [Anaerolineae bacterium]MDW8171818.1 DUF6159 family protein [Anaerolineae bacterium]